MNLLFVSSTDVHKKNYGGSICTNRNYLSFCQILGDKNVYPFNLTAGLDETFFSKIPKWINYFKGYSRGLTSYNIQRLIDLSEHYKIIFIDSSEYGVLNYYLKKKRPNVTIITFFHNVEYKIRLQNLKINPLTFWKFLILYYNEKKAIQYSDKIVVLNERDKKELRYLYHKIKFNKIQIIPISLVDTTSYHINSLTPSTASKIPTLLFVGHYWYANIHGIRWFVNNVLDSVNVKLKIIGNGMEDLSKEFSHPKIELSGYVTDLFTTIQDADYILVPIFKGSGMKVKTCEALMHGKNIIGTDEAFEGYKIDGQKVGAICNNKDEFIIAINKLVSSNINKFNNYNRNLFLEKYSFEATLIEFTNLLSD